MILKQKYSISKGTLKLFPYNSKDIMNREIAQRLADNIIKHFPPQKVGSDEYNI